MRRIIVLLSSSWCFSFVFLLQRFVAAVDGQSLGKCPKMETMKNFDPKQFEGQWYEVEKTFYMMEMTASCTSFNFTLNPDKTSFKVHVGTKSRITGNPNIFSGTATLLSKSKSVLNYQADSRLPNILSRMIPTTGLYHIMHSDYENYTVLWSCTSFGLFHTDIVWVLGRERDLAATSRAELYTLLYELNINPDRLILTKHEKCENFF
ncbi:Lipocalin/cytosolic fatty-acid binding domain,Invertebrate colouration protein,Calycin,Lipocalin [Cinara cedri]|uniref:Lipocalin/cytosolic fatty-acid binding domain,Invertebrate colouration protein,Calycin,Lipocalin n=1 Tax=Cinara cedri TaxID=506608 RepID=A0A5E4N638_9HEMI|nr:Lipocalin/cytosolic fatty-acid binding domain,Invertebrate colouration protein,Calycin,Lipocalin [Cinara cedri]